MKNVVKTVPNVTMIPDVIFAKMDTFYKILSASKHVMLAILTRMEFAPKSMLHQKEFTRMVIFLILSQLDVLSNITLDTNTSQPIKSSEILDLVVKKVPSSWWEPH